VNPGQAGLDIAYEIRFITEQMRATRNVQNDGIRQVDSNRRRVIAAVIGQLLQPKFIFGRLMRDCRQIGNLGSRIRQCHPRRKAKRQRGRRHGHKPHGTTVFGDKGDRQVSRCRSAAHLHHPPTVDGQERHPQRQIAASGDLLHHGSTPHASSARQGPRVGARD
jgi:hypothetical protein